MRQLIQIRNISLSENLVVIEALRARLDRRQAPGLHFFRDSHGKEIDLLFKSGSTLSETEIQASGTWHGTVRKGLDHFAQTVHPLQDKTVVYNGATFQLSDGLNVGMLANVPRLLEA